MLDGRNNNLSKKNVFCFLVVMFLVDIQQKALSQSLKEYSAASNQTNSFECTETSISYTNNYEITREEKIVQMDQALFESLSNYDICQNQSQGIRKGNADVEEELFSLGGSDQSVPSNDMSGGETSKSVSGLIKKNKSLSNAENKNQPGQISQSGAAAIVPGTFLNINSNGMTPEDIPSADNDSVLQAQIRNAAINEKDPNTKEKIWNEYRNYKGLPQK